MTQMPDCFHAIQGFFLATTILFIVVTIILLQRSRTLRKKLSDMVETLAGRDKELAKLKAESQNLLSPFIPETSRSIIISMDPNGKIIDTNDYACELFGYVKEDLVGKEATGLIFPQHAQQESLQKNIIHRIFANPKLYVEHETENIKKSGEHFWISWTNRIMYDDDGKPTELRSVGFDITKRKRLEEELEYMASIDPQTGVLNRQALLETGMRELKRAFRYHRALSVLIVQLDYFRGTDDQNSFSDDVIREVITSTRRMIRDSDSIGRVGDVEFALLLPETDIKQAELLADRIRQKIHEESLKKHPTFFLTIRFGITERLKEKDTFDEMLLRALNNLTKNMQDNSDLTSHPKVTRARKKKGV